MVLKVTPGSVERVHIERLPMYDNVDEPAQFPVEMSSRSPMVVSLQANEQANFMFALSSALNSDRCYHKVLTMSRAYSAAELLGLMGIPVHAQTQSFSLV